MTKIYSINQKKKHPEKKKGERKEKETAKDHSALFENEFRISTQTETMKANEALLLLFHQSVLSNTI